MASSGGHLLAQKAMRLARFAVEKTGKFIRDKIPQAAKPLEADAQPAYVRVSQRQPPNRLGQIRQAQGRLYSTKVHAADTIRHYSSQSGPKSRQTRASYPSSQTASRVNQSSGRAPFASTLRPSLTGGTLARHAGGYGLGGGRVGGARYFSHTPAAPAQVVTNVSQAVRAFWLSGQKARFDGSDPRTGEKRFRSVSSLQEEARHTMDMASRTGPGSFIDFKVSPTITAIGPLASVPRSPSASSCDYEMHQDTLNNTTLMSNLSVDFARALKDLAAIMNDLKRLSTLGDLPISLHDSVTLRVCFPGCDADTVEGLCRELNIKRGIVGQDEDFDTRNGTEMALLFPFAPSKPGSEAGLEVCERPTKRVKKDQVEWHEMLTPPRHASAGFSHLSATSQSFDAFDLTDPALDKNPWMSSPSGYSSLHESDLLETDDPVTYFFQPQAPVRERYTEPSAAEGGGYEGLQGIYRFIEQCDRARS
ncbi:hypothetical protein G647_05894 [Cladophialophora carrionii CBS 160.54]|uniref:Casein kinase II beta 2 subunit n=1 Tax=Cladophialophora carrionii CBS 160.54 TaxID=1279043 RepID=V9D4M8_9EURO|nr:uncharacterized protein G647_05894 [Cladophialophora carrionii CBS 160.54]ETI21825.1 hypothetical protein G647_05894 [Cladophialophora carrionii CBS 160.54]